MLSITAALLGCDCICVACCKLVKCLRLHIRTCKCCLYKNNFYWFFHESLLEVHVHDLFVIIYLLIVQRVHVLLACTNIVNWCLKCLPYSTID